MTAWKRCLPVSSCVGARISIVLASTPLGRPLIDFLVPRLTPPNFVIAAGVDAIDLLLLMSSKEGDTPKVEELLKAGANPAIKDKDGYTPLDLAAKGEIVEMLEAALARA